MRRSGWLPVFLLSTAVLGTFWVLQRQRPIKRADGVLIVDAPRQVNLAQPLPLPDRAGAKLQALAQFDLRARVLSREDYRFDRGAALSPIDLALGWQRMSDNRNLQDVEISQGNRFFYWRSESFPIPKDEVIASAANMHLIPADAAVERELLRTRVGDLIHLRGYLVEAAMSDGGTWRSSLVRTDSGAGACELILVEQYEISAR